MNKQYFSGKMICPAEFSNVEPVNVFHRQLDDYLPDGKLDKNVHMLFRKKFSIDKPERTVIRITADDYYKLYVNGSYVGQGPASGFHFSYYFNEFDITDYLESGKNTIAIHAYYQGLINRVWVSGDDRLGVIFDVISDGKVIAKSDETVRCRLHDGYSIMGEVGYKTQFMELYDSRCECVGFFLPDYDDSFWEYAKEYKNSDHIFIPQKTKNLVTEKVLPQIVDKRNGSVFVDFGSAYVGYFNIVCEGNAGDEIVLKFGQELDDNNEVRYNLRANCTYEEKWILSGGEDSLDQFDYKSFRYVSIILPEACVIKDIHLVSRHYPFKLIADCKYHEEELLMVWDLCVNSLCYGVQDNIQDCMEREKGQYLGDGSFTSLTYAVLTGDTAIMEKLMDDALRTQFINDGLMTCAPCSFMQEIAEYPLMLPHLAEAHYTLTGDIDYLYGNFEKIKKLVDYYIDTYSQDSGLIGNLDKWCVVDWPHEARDGYDYDLSEGKVAEGIHNVINAYLYGAMNRVNRLAVICGMTEVYDTAPFKKAYIDAFYDSEQGLFCDTPVSKHTSLASNAFALAFELCPDEDTKERIVEMIMKKNAEASAFFVTFASLYSLKRLGREREIKEFLSHNGRWLRMIREGATVTFEAWGKDAKWNTSLFHLCYAYAALYMTDWGMEKLF